MAFYYGEATTVAGMMAESTRRLFDDSFAHAFSVKLIESNIRNELFVQEVDESGQPVTGARFALFSKDQVTIDADGSVRVIRGAGQLVRPLTSFARGKTKRHLALGHEQGRPSDDWQ